MKRKALLMLLLLMVIGTGLGYTKSVSPQIISGFMTGNTYRNLSDQEKHGYAMGIVDGIFASPVLFDAPTTEIQWIVTCVRGMTSEQLVAILNKYLNENPATWHEPMNLHATLALAKSCTK